MKSLIALVLLIMSFTIMACPPGTWPRNQSSSSGGGASTSRGGGLSTSRGGGASTSRGGGLSTSRGGGLSTSSGGGLSTSSGGGLSTSNDGDNTYCSNIPPWSVFVKHLEENGYTSQTKTIRKAFRSAGLPLR